MAGIQQKHIVLFYPESVVAMLTTHDEMCSKGYHINAFSLFQNKIWSMIE